MCKLSTCVICESFITKQLLRTGLTNLAPEQEMLVNVNNLQSEDLSLAWNLPLCYALVLCCAPGAFVKLFNGGSKASIY